MKKIKGIILLLVMMVLLASNIFSSSRVICNVDIISDNSAEVELVWSDDSTDENIRIITWERIDDNTLKVIYDRGANIISGFNKRKIENANYEFPMRIILEEQGARATSFSDMPVELEVKYSILNLYNRNIINGYPDGTFKPDAQVTRAEFAKMISKTADYIVDDGLESSFIDIHNDHWATDYVMTLANKGILKGRTDGSFDPSGNITIGEVLAVINRTFILYDREGDYIYDFNYHWSNSDFLAMVQGDVVRSTDNYYNPYTADRKATREECAVMLSRVLEQLHEVK